MAVSIITPGIRKDQKDQCIRTKPRAHTQTSLLPIERTHSRQFLSVESVYHTACHLISLRDMDLRLAAITNIIYSSIPILVSTRTWAGMLKPILACHPSLVQVQQPRPSPGIIHNWIMFTKRRTRLQRMATYDIPSSPASNLHSSRRQEKHTAPCTLGYARHRHNIASKRYHICGPRASRCSRPQTCSAPKSLRPGHAGNIHSNSLPAPAYS